MTWLSVLALTIGGLMLVAWLMDRSDDEEWMEAFLAEEERSPW